MPKDLLSQQYKFVGRGNHEKLREFNQRINYILRQMTREFEAMPRSVKEAGEVINPPEAEIVSNNNGMIEAAIIKYITLVPSEEPPREEKPRDTRERKQEEQKVVEGYAVKKPEKKIKDPLIIEKLEAIVKEKPEDIQGGAPVSEKPTTKKK